MAKLLLPVCLRGKESRYTARFFQEVHPFCLFFSQVLRHLLSHTSGLIDPPGLESSLEKGVPFPDLLPDARRFQPGESFHYSNLGFGLIGSVMESVTGQPVGSLFRKCLF